MYNIHTHLIDSVPCLYSIGSNEMPSHLPAHAAASVGIHPWHINETWHDTLASISSLAAQDKVWAIGECGLDKLRGPQMEVQMDVMRAHIALAENAGKPLIVHCVKAFDQLLLLRKETAERCKAARREPQPWVIHGFRGKPEQAKQMVAKGLHLSFGHQYNIESIRFLFSHAFPFYLETDDLHLSVCQIYEQVAHHLGVDIAHLESLCDPRHVIFHH